MTDAIAAMQQRIDDLEAALHEAKAGNIMEALAMQLGIEYNVARCKWVAAGYPRKCFADALECALIERDAERIQAAGAVA